jgi:ABC-type multidrug transport system ATPase subunit
MDVISGRKTGGSITGDILVNGQPKDDNKFGKLTGYVEQNDIHDPHSTVREGLLFSARMVGSIDCFPLSLML